MTGINWCFGDYEFPGLLQLIVSAIATLYITWKDAFSLRGKRKFSDEEIDKIIESETYRYLTECKASSTTPTFAGMSQISCDSDWSGIIPLIRHGKESLDVKA